MNVRETYHSAPRRAVVYISGMQQSTGATPPRVMTIAGTDSGGGAGVAADLRTFAACGVHGCVAVTAVTVQNSVGVTGVHTVPPEVAAAIASMISVVASIPVLAASMHGDPLLAASALDAYRTLLFPRATVVTPNLDEVRLLAGVDVHDRAAQYAAAKALHALGPRYVLVKGGHLREDTDACVDLLFDGDTFTELPGPRFATGNTHGGGDSMAAALASGLARGLAVPAAVAFAKRYIVEAVRSAYPLGAGHGPVSSLWTGRPWWDEPPL